MVFQWFIMAAGCLGNLEKDIRLLILVLQQPIMDLAYGMEQKELFWLYGELETFGKFL